MIYTSTDKSSGACRASAALALSGPPRCVQKAKVLRYHVTDCRPATQARLNGTANGHAMAVSGANAELADTGAPASAKGAPNGVHVAATASCNARLTAQVAAAQPWEDAGQEEESRVAHFFDPDFSPVAESFDVNPEVRGVALCPPSARGCSAHCLWLHSVSADRACVTAPCKTDSSHRVLWVVAQPSQHKRVCHHLQGMRQVRKIQGCQQSCCLPGRRLAACKLPLDSLRHTCWSSSALLGVLLVMMSKVVWGSFLAYGRRMMACGSCRWTSTLRRAG